MNSSPMELSVLKLTSPRKRLEQSGRFTFDVDPTHSFASSNVISPKCKNLDSAAWTEPNRMMADDELFTIFEQHRAAIPFKWEASPGTRRDQEVTRVDSQISKDGMSDSELDYSSASSPTFSSSPSSSTSSSVSGQEGAPGRATEFQANLTSPSSFATPTKDKCSVPTLSDNNKLADEAGKGRVLALKPPPGMQSIKQLLILEGENRITPFCFSARPASTVNNGCLSKSSSISSTKLHHGRSFRRDGILALPFLSAPKEHIEEPPTTVLGFEEWNKVVEQQEKLERQEQQETPAIKTSHHRTMSMPRLPFSFRKKSTAEKEFGNDFVDADAFFNEEFGKKDGSRERGHLFSLSSGSLEDFQAGNNFFDIDGDFADPQEVMVTGSVDSPETIVEHDKSKEVEIHPKNDASENSSQVAVSNEKRKIDALSRIGRFFHSKRTSGHHRPARLSSVTPASPPPLARSQSELQLRKAAHLKQVSKTSGSPLLKMCLSNPIGQVLLKNVRQLRSFEFRTTRALTST